MGCIFCEDFRESWQGEASPRLLRFVPPCPLSTSTYGRTYQGSATCVACLKVKPLEMQIRRAKETLDDLLEQHRKLRSRMNQSHNRLVLGLPREVVSMIFEYTLPGVPDLVFGVDKPQVALRRMEAAAPLTLGAVCRDWRRIAWSTPQLWTFIRVRLDPPDLASYTKFTQEWICRSGSLPLSLHAYIHDSSDPSLPDDRVNNLINIINQTASRWEMLDLRKIPEEFVCKFIYKSQSSVPMLSSLRIETLEVDDWYVASFQAENGARPSPTHINIVHLRLKSIDIKWNNATRVELTNLQVDECLEVLRLAPRLQDLKFVDIRPANMGFFPLPSHPIVHRNLQTFALYPSVEPLSIFLDHITFPSLETLDIGTEYEPLPVAALSSFFQRSSCRLKRLVIKDADFENDGLISLLFELPSLVSLDLLPILYSNHSPSVLFKLLASSSISASSSSSSEEASDPESSTFLPHLRILKYHSAWKLSWDEPGEDRFTWDLLPPIFGPVSQRNIPPRRPFQRLDLLFDRDEMSEDDPTVMIGEEYIDSLLSILAAGFELNIAYPDEDLDVISFSIG